MSPFVLRFKGTSRVDAQPHRGDDGIVRAQPWVEHGAVGEAGVDAEVTVKMSLALAHRPVADARDSAAGISAAQASVSAAYIHCELSDRQGTVARTAKAAQAAACMAREAAEAIDGGNGL